MIYLSPQAKEIIQTKAIISGGVASILNGILAWFRLKGNATIPLTLDTISSPEKSLFSTVVLSAFILCTILGTITFFMFGKQARNLQLANDQLLERPFFFFGVRTILFFALFAFGTAALVALFLQRFWGSVTVSPVAGAIVTGVLSGIAAWFINVAVMKAMLRPE